MGWFTIVMKLFGTLVELLKIAEQAFDDVPESGEQKREFVLEAIKAIVQGMSGVVWTPELWTKIEKVCGFLIDSLCVFFFNSKKKAA